MAANANHYGSGQTVVLALYNGGLQGYQVGTKSNAAIGTAPFQAVSVWDGANHTLTVDGVAAASVAAPGTLASPGYLCVGLRENSGVDARDGPHAEHLIITGPLTAAHQATIRNSQKTYYGTP